MHSDLLHFDQQNKQINNIKNSMLMLLRKSFSANFFMSIQENQEKLQHMKAAFFQNK